MTINEFIRSKSYDFDPILDGEFHELPTDKGKVWYKGKIFETSGGKQYTIFNFGNWKTDEKYRFKESERNYSKKELQEMETRQREEEERSQRERAELQEKISERVQKDWATLTNEPPESLYLSKKGLGPIPGTRSKPNPSGEPQIIIPMKDLHGKIWGVQKILPSGDKAFVDGQKVEGLFFQLGVLHPKKPIYICEGVATGASLFEGGAGCVLAAFNALNMGFVGRLIRRAYKDAPLVFCGDNDIYSEKNVGKRAAYKAAFDQKGTVFLPTFKKSDQKPTDWNDFHQLYGQKVLESQIACHKPLGPLEVIPTEYNLRKRTF